ncbi:MAG: metallophosphoesterase [Deltaproteobacteria bacterium]|nr:metallophosphoesterase [Deltaproteobacteria bacterium]
MRLAHCSDLHLLSHAGARWLELANKRWIGAMNLISTRSRHHHVAAFEDMVADLNTQGIDHVLCTGDVTNLALRREFEFARGKFDGLAHGTTNITVIPGNHDAYVAEGVGLFAETFAPFASTDPAWAWTASDLAASEPLTDLLEDGSPRWPIVRVRGDVALIGLSTSRQTPWFTAHGRIGPGQLARLERVLNDPRLAGKFRLIAIHHPPAGKRALSRIRGLRDHAAFAQVIAGAGADLIVHGHEHRDMTESLAGPGGAVPVRGIVSGTYFHDKPERTARYRIFEINGGTLVRDSMRIWDRGARRFVADAGVS